MARGTGSRMGKQWETIPGSSQALTSAGSTAPGALPFTTKGTILRMLAEYLIVPTAVTVAGDQVLLGVGFALISSDAFTVAALPDPLGEPEYPWLYWATHHLHFPTATSGTAGEDLKAGYGYVRKHIDIRSMRKFNPRESLVMITEYANVSGLPPVTFHLGSARVLIGLH